MAGRTVSPVSERDFDTTRDILTDFGLSRNQGTAILELHPALTGHVIANRKRWAAREDIDAWAKAFVDVFAAVADSIGPLSWREQHGVVGLHKGNLYRALSEARRLHLLRDEATLLQSLARLAQNQHDYTESNELLLQLRDASRKLGEQELEAVTCHQLGVVAQLRQDPESAREWYEKTLILDAELDDLDGIAATYHQLGSLMQDTRDFQSAERFYKKSLAMARKSGNLESRAKACQQLGTLALDQWNLDAAERWYLEAIIPRPQGTWRTPSVSSPSSKMRRSGGLPSVTFSSS